MPQQRPKSKTDAARQLLLGHALSSHHIYTQSDSTDHPDDDLELEDAVWEWIYEDVAPVQPLDLHSDTASNKENASPNTTPNPKKRKAAGALYQLSRQHQRRRIIGARRGRFEVRLGDAVLLKAEGHSEDWVALLYEIDQASPFPGDADSDAGEDDEKVATFMWFNHASEIRSKSHRHPGAQAAKDKERAEALPNEIFATAAFDENLLDSINGRAVIVSPKEFARRYPTGKVPRQAREFGRVFVCRRGCNARTATYTQEFCWEDVYRGADDMATLREKVERETKATRKRKMAGTPAKRKQDFSIEEDGVEDEDMTDSGDDKRTPRTPRKKRKLNSTTTTPRKTPSKRTTPGSKSRHLTTPTSHRRIITKRPLSFTPLGTRLLSPTHTSSPHAIARTQLHVASVPLSLPCREEEFAQVYSHLDSAISDGTGSCIYISGTPGTGKTATVREVVAQLHASVAAEELDDFIFVEINGMKVTDPHQSYALLWEALTGERVSATHAVGLLEKEFSSPSPRRTPCVVLMDELDQLVTKNQRVMYNFFNWPGLRHSRLIVLAVANTMDLPERTLSNKISSRLGLTRITFPGYSHEQLISIIQSRLEGVPGTVVEPDAVQFASRKVAQVSGDARRALDICRRAVEIAEAEAEESAGPGVPGTPSKSGRERRAGEGMGQAAPGRVTIPIVQRAIREATTSPLQLFLRQLPLASKAFLAALMARVRKTGVGEASLGDVMDEARRIGSMTSVVPFQKELMAGGKGSRVLAMGLASADLAEAGIVVVEPRRGERSAKVRLSAAEYEIKLAYKEDEEAKALGFAYE